MTTLLSPPPSTHGNAPPSPEGDEEPSLFIEDQRFSIVPEWVIDADLPDAAFRLYSLLLRFGGTSGSRMPSRQTLARRLRRSTDAVDRAMRALVCAGIVVVEHRRRDGVYLSNRYHVRTSRPTTAPKPRQSEADDVDAGQGGDRRSAATPAAAPAESPQDARSHAGADSPSTSGGGRTNAATPPPPDQSAQEPSGGGRRFAATGRTSAAGVAADLRPNPEVLTQRTPPPPTSSPTPGSGRAAREEEADALLNDCGLADRQALLDLAARCAAARTALGQSPTRWSAPCVAAALQLAVKGRGWPPHLAVPALLAIAADPATRSTMRLAEAGPWWDQPVAPAAADPGEAAELARLEARLDDLDGGRLRVQAAARAELTDQGLPLTRSTVVRRACEILDRASTSTVSR